MVDICIECKTEVTMHADTPFCKKCAAEFFEDKKGDDSDE